MILCSQPRVAVILVGLGKPKLILFNQEQTRKLILSAGSVTKKKVL
jgi:hypothetical protein